MTIDIDHSNRQFPFNGSTIAPSPKRLKMTTAAARVLATNTAVAARVMATNTAVAARVATNTAVAARVAYNCLQHEHYNYRFRVSNFLENFFYLYHYHNGNSLIEHLGDFQVNTTSKKRRNNQQGLLVLVSPENLQKILSTITLGKIFGHANRPHNKKIRNCIKEWLLCFTISYHALLLLRSSFPNDCTTRKKHLVETTIGLAVSLITHGCKSTLSTLNQLRKFIICFNIAERRLDGKSVILNLWKKGINQAEAMQNLIDFVHKHPIDEGQEAEMVAKFDESLFISAPSKKKYKLNKHTLRQRNIEFANLIFPALGVTLYQMIFGRTSVKEFMRLEDLVLGLIPQKRALQKGEEQVSNCTEQQESQTLPLRSPAVTESEQSQAKQDFTIFRYELHDSTLCEFAETVGRSIHKTLSTHQASTASAVSRRNTKGGTPYVNQNGCKNPRLPRIHHNTCYFYEHHQCEKVSRSVTKKMAVLTDRAKPVSISNCVQSSDVHGCNDLFNYIRETQNPYCDGHEHNYRQLFAGNFHLQCKRGDHISKLHFYDYHRDKKQFPVVTFIPLRSSFYTILCVPNGFIDDTLKAFSDDVCLSKKLFQEMRDKLNKGDQVILDTYIKNMRQYAKKEYCGKETQIIFFHCQPGSALSFEAWRFVHGTVTVDADDAKMRDLLIIHELQGK